VFGEILVSFRIVQNFEILDLAMAISQLSTSNFEGITLKGWTYIRERIDQEYLLFVTNTLSFYAKLQDTLKV
jgi:hypothetical protein